MERESLESLRQLAEMTDLEKAMQWVKKGTEALWRARAKGDIVGGVRMRVGSTRAEKNRNLREDIGSEAGDGGEVEGHTRREVTEIVCLYL